MENYFIETLAGKAITVRRVRREIPTEKWRVEVSERPCLKSYPGGVRIRELRWRCNVSLGNDVNMKWIVWCGRSSTSHACRHVVTTHSQIFTRPSPAVLKFPATVKIPPSSAQCIPADMNFVHCIRFFSTSWLCGISLCIWELIISGTLILIAERELIEIMFQKKWYELWRTS